MNSPEATAASSTVVTPLTYTPAHAKRKLLMVLAGISLFCLGFSQLQQPLRLLVFGVRARAEATVVIKTKKGLPDLTLTDDLEVQAKKEQQDRSYVFWNEFRFQTADGRIMDVRAPVGSQLQPLYPLLDGNGLPTTDTIYYDPANLQTVVFPFLMSTWFAPGMLTLAGLICTCIGSVLFFWANKPIELPHLPSKKSDNPEHKNAEHKKAEPNPKS